MLKSFIKIFASTPRCPNCSNNNTKEDFRIFGKVRYKCVECTHTWWE